MSNTEANISLRVSPNARKNELVAFKDRVLQVRISAPPVKGKTNQELIDFLSKVLGVGRTSLSILRGHNARNKVIAIAGLSQEDAVKRLTLELSSSGGATRKTHRQ
ncbi:DUF167 domain-containing protein [Chloroflexota bacterium]